MINLSHFVTGYYRASCTFSNIRHGQGFTQFLEPLHPEIAGLTNYLLLAPIFHHTLCHVYLAQLRCLGPKNTLSEATRKFLPYATHGMIALAFASQVTSLCKAEKTHLGLVWIEGHFPSVVKVAETVSFATFTILGFPVGEGGKALAPRALAMGQLFGIMVQLLIERSSKGLKGLLTLADKMVHDYYQADYFSLSLKIGMVARSMFAQPAENSRWSRCIQIGKAGVHSTLGCYLVGISGLKFIQGQGCLSHISMTISGIRMVLSQTSWADGRVDKILKNIRYVISVAGLVREIPRGLDENERLVLAIHLFALLSLLEDNTFRPNQ